MMSREMDRPPFAQALLPSGLGHDWVLECIGSVLDLAKFDQMAAGVYASPDGRPGYQPLVMVKTPPLRQSHKLSALRMERALKTGYP